MHNFGWILLGIMVFQVCLFMGSIQIYYISLYDRWGKRDIPILLVDVGCIFPVDSSVPDHFWRFPKMVVPPNHPFLWDFHGFWKK